jgi:hypothetical protein
VDDERIFQLKLKKEADAEAHIYGNGSSTLMWFATECPPHCFTYSSFHRYNPSFPELFLLCLSLSVYMSLPAGDKEKFVTAAYKEKLAEMGRWKAEDSRLQALETATTVCI